MKAATADRRNWCGHVPLQLRKRGQISIGREWLVQIRRVMTWIDLRVLLEFRLQWHANSSELPRPNAHPNVMDVVETSSMTGYPPCECRKRLGIVHGLHACASYSESGSVIWSTYRAEVWVTSCFSQDMKRSVGDGGLESRTRLSDSPTSF